MLTPSKTIYTLQHTATHCNTVVMHTPESTGGREPWQAVELSLKQQALEGPYETRYVRGATYIYIYIYIYTYMYKSAQV